MAMSERDAGLFEAPEPPEPRASLRAIETALLVSGRDAARAYARSVDAELRDKRQGWR